MAARGSVRVRLRSRSSRRPSGVVATIIVQTRRAYALAPHAVGSGGDTHLQGSNTREPVRVLSFIKWLSAAAISLGGVGLFVVAFLDSSFVSLPNINDALVVLMVTHNKARMPYYVAMATLGSVAGCYVIYYLAEKGGEAFLRKRLAPARVERALAVYQKTRTACADRPGAAATARALQALRARCRHREAYVRPGSSSPSAWRAESATWH